MTRVRHQTRQNARALGYGLEAARRDDTPTAAARDLGPCVYAVRTPDRLVKIGFTTNLHQRIRSYGAVWADVLLALPGTWETEQELHTRFGPYLARGREFYFPTIEIMQWINSERERLGAPAV